MPEQPSDSLGIDTGGFSSRETTFIPPLQKAWNTENAISSIMKLVLPFFMTSLSVDRLALFDSQ